ncbi:MAG: hypothetical protein JSR47_08840 [Proteobacteria bacterium]|nr:hypothetical protein [Pseudomonadota bacterium]MBS0548154.1 hypothetical protein [Pseudomonadota bacterium]
MAAATGTATPDGEPLLNGALLTTDGVGSGTTGLLSTSTTTPNGGTSTTALNVPSPILANTAVLPSGANGGALVQVGGGAVNVGGVSTNGPLGGTGNGVVGNVVNTTTGVLGNTGAVR